MWKGLWKHKDYIKTNKWRDYKCPICGNIKSICMQDEYVYKIQGAFYCSYTCWRKALRDKPKIKRRNYVKYD